MESVQTSRGDERQPGGAGSGRAQGAVRRQVAAAGAGAAAVFAADKISKVRELRMRAACDAGFSGDAALRRKPDHYVASRWMLERELGDHPVVKALAFELEALQSLPPNP